MANSGSKTYKAGVLLRAGWGAYDAVSGIADVLKPAIVGKLEEKYCKNKPNNDPECNEIKSFIKSVEDVKSILDITSLGGHGIDGLVKLVANWRKVKREIPDLETQFPQFNQIDDAIDGSNGIAKKCEDIDACFIAGTLITTPSGYKPIGQIKAGDLVLSKDPATGKEDYKTVKQAIVRHTNALVRIIAQKDTIFATPEHPFWVNNTWVEAAKIKIGDKLTLAATNDFTATNAPQSLPYLARSSIEAEQMQLIDTSATVYNFEVEDFHTYFVGKQAVWVHNSTEHFAVNVGKFDITKLRNYLRNIETRHPAGAIGSPPRIYQESLGATLEYEIKGGNNSKIWADGLNLSTGTVIEAKFISNPSASPFIDGSSCYPPVRQKVLDQQTDEFRRYADIINDPNVPLVQLEVFVSDILGVPYFQKLLNDFNIPGKITVRP